MRVATAGAARSMAVVQVAMWTGADGAIHLGEMTGRKLRRRVGRVGVHVDTWDTVWVGWNHIG